MSSSLILPLTFAVCFLSFSLKGHDIYGFDLDLLMHRISACKVNTTAFDNLLPNNALAKKMMIHPITTLGKSTAAYF